MPIYLSHHARHSGLAPLRFGRRVELRVPRQQSLEAARTCYWARQEYEDSPCLRCPRRVALLPTRHALVIQCDWTDRARVDEIMQPTSTIPQLSPQRMVASARMLVSATSISHVLVVEDSALLAIVAAKDIAAAPAGAPVGALVRGSPWVVSTDEMAGRAAALMRSKNSTYLIVIDGREVVGLVVASDFEKLGLAATA